MFLLKSIRLYIIIKIKDWNVPKIKGGENMNYKNIANAVIENVGGKENIASAAHCVTRLRLVLKDTTKYNKEIIEKGLKEYFLMEVNYKLYLEQKL